MKNLHFLILSNFSLFFTVHGGLTPWSPYSFCSKPCNTGYRERTRSCTDPPPQFNGRNCTCDQTDESYGLDNCTVKYEDIRTCNVLACPRKIYYCYLQHVQKLENLSPPETISWKCAFRTKVLQHSRMYTKSLH